MQQRWENGRGRVTGLCRCESELNVGACCRRGCVCVGVFGCVCGTVFCVCLSFVFVCVCVCVSDNASTVLPVWQLRAYTVSARLGHSQSF
jgi:hypothetical protein